MPPTQPRPLREEPVSGAVPRFEIPGWRARYGIVAGITGRGDGGDRGFDLGLWTDAPVREVMSRWRAFRQAEPGFSAVILGNQIHETRVAWHNGGSGWVQVEGVDGHATATRGVLLTVTVADCVPVYVIDPVREAVALLHSGWRGTSGGILRAGIEALIEGAGSTCSDMLIHCGVGICGECYEVGSEVMTSCGLACPGSGPWRADLHSVLTKQARGFGVENISTSQWCSMHDRPAFFSHRGSGGADGRMVAYLGIPATAP